MKTSEPSEFKPKCLQLIDEVTESGGTLVIMKNGELEAMLGSPRKPVKSLFGAHKGEIKILGDIMSPIGADSGEEHRYISQPFCELRCHQFGITFCE